MKYFKYIFIFCALKFTAQTINNEVINTAGQTHTINSNFIYTDNVGEPFILTEQTGTYILNQGFLQVYNSGPTILITYNNVSCADKTDGNISISVSNVLSTQTVSYIWQPNNYCPSSTCNIIDSLVAGVYNVTVSIKTNIGGSFTEKLYPQIPITITDINGPCKVKIYNTITSNGDGINDFFTIDNIEEFPDNEITIFNRWGKQLYNRKNYDNKNGWPTANEKITPSTYFYILNLGKSINPIKGWVEILKN